MKKSARTAIAAALGTVLVLSLPASAGAAEVDASVPDGAGAAEVDASVPDGAVTVEVVAANGSGCAPGTATVTANSDRTGFRVRYRDFVAESGSSTDVTDRRKNCQLGVVVSVPAGWTFAIAEASYRGRARLAAGSTGLQRTNYYWQGSAANNRTDESFTGPLYGNWSTHDVAPALIYVPCAEERVLNINTELRVNGGASGQTSSMSMTSSDGDVDTLFNFAWTRC